MKKFLSKKSNAFFSSGLGDFGLGILLVLFVFAAAGAYFLSSRSSSNVLTFKSDILHLSSNVSTLFGGASGYGDLDNSIAIQGGVVPKNMQKGERIINPWGGEIILSPSEDESSFFIEVNNVPDKECSDVINDQEGLWVSIAVNGSELDEASPADIIALCVNDKNTIRYEAR